jgi:F-type H+-transporting ATPase subunit delta
MLKESVARRYSAALFALARDAGTIGATVRELDAFVAALKSDPAIAEFFGSPVIERARKTELLNSALSGRASELISGFLTLLIAKWRENLVETIARQMHELSDEDAQRATAHIATPAGLDPAELADLARRLSNVYKRTIVPQAKIDPGILGGAVVQVGDKYVDASIAGKLEAVRRHLLAHVDAPGSTSPNGKGT